MKFAIIGCGRIAHRHAEEIVNNPKAELVSVCDIVPERTKEFARRYSAREQYLDYRELLEKSNVDVVNICTPSGLHAEMGIAAALAGKHVIVEKPMVMTLEDADALIETCERHNVLLAVCHQNRFNPAVQRLRRAVEAGMFGQLTHASAVVRWFRPQEYYDQAEWRGTWAMDGGCLMNQSIHNIDLLLWMMGPVSSVFGYTTTRLRRIEAEDVGVAVLRFASGALGVIEAATTVYPQNLEETLNIFGERGTVVLGGIAVNKVEVWRIEEDFETDAEGSGEEVASVYGYGHGALIRDFIDSVAGGRKPYIDGCEGRKAVEVVLAIYESSRTGKEVMLPLCPPLCPKVKI